MNLIIKNNLNVNIRDFCNWLIGYMLSYLQENIDKRQLIRFDEYINNNDIINFIYQKRYISCYDILISSINALNITANGDTWIIEIDRDASIPNTYAKFFDIIALINYGNLSISPYPIYTKMMDEFAENLSDYYEKFIREQ